MVNAKPISRAGLGMKKSVGLKCGEKVMFTFTVLIVLTFVSQFIN